MITLKSSFYKMNNIFDCMNNIYFDFNEIMNFTDDYIKLLEYLQIHAPIFNDYIMKMRELKTSFFEVREKLPEIFTF